MRNRSQKTAETLLLEPTKNKEKACKPPDKTHEKRAWDAHAKKQNPSKFCAQAMAQLQPEKSRNVAVETHEKQRNSAQAIWNRSRKNAETLLLEPIKNREKTLPQARQTFAQRKTWKAASHQAKLKKKVFGTRMRKSRTLAGFVPKALRNRSRSSKANLCAT